MGRQESELINRQTSPWSNHLLYFDICKSRLTSSHKSSYICIILVEIWS